jgi:hypothetical protein
VSEAIKARHARFLRTRLGDAIERGDDATANRLRAQLDALLNAGRRR